MENSSDHDLERLATAYGLERLRELDPGTFAQARRAGVELGARTVRPDDLAAEPAHTCRFPARGPRA